MKMCQIDLRLRAPLDPKVDQRAFVMVGIDRLYASHEFASTVEALVFMEGYLRDFRERAARAAAAPVANKIIAEGGR